MNLIQRMTEGCDKPDCRIQYDGSSSTLLAQLETFDKNGVRTNDRAVNTVTSLYHCHVCGARWTVRQRDGHDDDIEKDVPA